MSPKAQEEKPKYFTVLPYTLGGHDDPHFQDLSAMPVPTAVREGATARVDQSTVGNTAGAERNSDSPGDTQEDTAGNWTPDRIEANKSWWDREDWEVPGNGGTNDYLFEDKEED